MDGHGHSDGHASSLEELQEERRRERERLRTSKFDLVSSLFTALIIFIGTFVLMLLIVWITSRWSFPPQAIKPIIETPAGRGENAEGTERDFEPPGAEEVEELMEPTLQDTIEAVTDAVSSVAASLDTMATETSENVGDGKGDSRPPGPEAEGDDIIPRFERWQLNFTAKAIGDYSQQLDFFKIELGVIGGPVQGVDIASNLSGSPQKRRIVKTEEEKRLYFMWTSPSPLMQFDKQLLQKAGIAVTPGRNMMKFIDPNLENLLAHTELEFAKTKGHNSVTEIAKTIFESKADGNNYVFEVVDQRYRKPRK